MSLTETITTSSTNLADTLTRPASVTFVSFYTSANEASNFTTTAPKVLYTAPSDCKYAKIYWSKAPSTNSAGRGNSSYLPATTSNSFYGISLKYNGITREIFSGSESQTVFINNFYDSAMDNTPMLQENDTLIKSGSSYLFLSGDVFTLAPGEQLLLTTGNSTNSQYFTLNFEAWVYN
jgi:hypothetical protein